MTRPRPEWSMNVSNGKTRRLAVDVAVGIILVIAASALLLHLSSTDAEFSRYNLQWNGTSDFFDALESRGSVMIRDPAVLGSRQNETLLMIAPRRAPTEAEGTEYERFVNTGNTLVLVDDFGSGNEILEAIGSSVRLDHGKLSSHSREFEVSYAPIGYPVAGRWLVADLSKVVFNHPVAVSGGYPLINTTHLSWIDDDGDGRVNRLEPMKQFTVATVEDIGPGRVVVIGDASLFINAMQGLPDCDNELLLERLVAETTLVDQQLSRTAVAAGPISIFLWVRETPSLVVLVTALSLGVVAWSFNRKRG